MPPASKIRIAALSKVGLREISMPARALCARASQTREKLFELSTSVGARTLSKLRGTVLSARVFSHRESNSTQGLFEFPIGEKAGDVLKFREILMSTSVLRST